MIDFPIELNTHLKALEGPYSIVLPTCKACVDSGCHIIVRSSRQNAVAKQARLNAEHEREVLRQEMAATKEASNVVTSSVNVPRGDEAQAAEHAEVELPQSSPRRSRRNNRNASPR
jgi:hypothetical protein